jgi:hypothetical protein
MSKSVSAEGTDASGYRSQWNRYTPVSTDRKKESYHCGTINPFLTANI